MFDAMKILDQAAANTAKWGMQDFRTLGLAVAEEAGELAQAILQHLHEGGERGRIREEAVDLGALCLQVMAHFSVEHGDAAAPEVAPAGDVRFESQPACSDYLREAMDYIIDLIGWADSFPRQCHDRIRKVCEAVKRAEPLPFKPDRPACAASNKADDGGAWWCNTHNREAKGRDGDGGRCCDMALSGEAKACAVVRAPGTCFAALAAGRE